MLRKKKPTKAQQWQRKRYRAKGTVCGVIQLLGKLLKLRVLTPSENIALSNCIGILTHTRALWNKANNLSKRNYLSSSGK